MALSRVNAIETCLLTSIKGSKRFEPLSEMTDIQYSGGERVLTQTASHRGLVPAQLLSTGAE